MESCCICFVVIVGLGILEGFESFVCRGVILGVVVFEVVDVGWGVNGGMIVFGVVDIIVFIVGDVSGWDIVIWFVRD